MKNNSMFQFLDFSDIKMLKNPEIQINSNIYGVILSKNEFQDKKYGRNYFDFRFGSLIFLNPNQEFTLTFFDEMILSKSKAIFFEKEQMEELFQFPFFNYKLEEALHVSENEFKIIETYFQQIKEDKQHLIKSHFSDLIKKIEIFYERQFTTRSDFHKEHIARFQQSLSNYYDGKEGTINYIPNVQFFATKLSFSSAYLNEIMKKEIDLNAQEFIHKYVVEKAKNKLLFTDNSITKIATDLGFEYPQYFITMFTNKVGISPKEYRNLC
nr:helix-turn-helix domain-containing protein [Aureivirga marina]